MSHFVFHKTLDLFKSKNLKDVHILIGVSGGLDSIALLDILHQIASPQNLKLCVIYVHHGKSSGVVMQNYRDESQKRVTQFCKSLAVPFYVSDYPQKELKSEGEFREFRYAQFQKILKQTGAHLLAVAHNSDDILETRLMHLIRGCGLEALKGMEILGSIPNLSLEIRSVSNPRLLRPFLLFSREKILDYAHTRKLEWLEDPSNLDESFLRNWLRTNWLPKLEQKQPGSRFRLGQSLAQIVSLIDQSNNKDSLSHLLTHRGISRPLFRELSLLDQKRLLFLYMKKQQIKNYSQSHINELLKHLERPNKRITLNLLKRKWEITSDFFFCH